MAPVLALGPSFVVRAAHAEWVGRTGCLAVPRDTRPLRHWAGDPIPFGLTPLDQVRPWGRERLKLHWFGLTDGWYCIDLGDHELLRYTERTVRALRGDGDGSAPHPYTDYFVVRLWEDMIALLSAAMEPVPDDLVGFVAGNPLRWSWEDAPEADAAAEWTETAP